MPNRAQRVPTNTTPDSRATVQLKKVRFAELWDAYPGGTPYVDPKTGEVPQGFENQCAIRLSVTLHKVGVEMHSFRGKGQIRLDGKRTAVLASEMADWLRLKPMASMGTPENITGKNWQEKIKGRTGIVAFKNYWIRVGQSAPSGGHIDLWKGSRMTSGSVRGAMTNFFRFNLGLESGLGYSDLGKATEILFWEVR
ncbi:type VI secretion system amidase effector protein Tae4 [Variovorax sp. LARHSF232]